jgi:hypothetical protein
VVTDSNDAEDIWKAIRREKKTVFPIGPVLAQRIATLENISETRKSGFCASMTIDLVYG